MKDENPFKEKLYHHTMPVRDELWNRIELQLPVVRKRFPFFWFTFASVVLIAGIILVWNNQISPVNRDNLTPEMNNLLSEPAHNAIPASEISVNDKEFHDVSLTSDGDYAVNENINVPGHNSPALTKKPLSKKKNNPSANNLSVESGLNTSSSNSLSTSSANSSVISSLNSSTLVEENLSPRSVAVFKITTSLPFAGIDLLENETILPELLSIKPDPSCYKFTGQEKMSNLSLDVFASPGFAPRTFESDDSESIVYAQAREATEESRYAWGAGARINLKVNHEWAVRAGIMYEQIGDVFDYTDTLATKQTTVTDSFFAADGTFLYTQTSTVLIFGTLIKKIHNRYHRLDIPLLASYELPMGRGVLMVNAGPVINLTSSSRGQILDPMYLPQHLTAGEPNQLKAYKTSLGLSIYLGAGALIPISKNFSGLIEPRFLYRIKPVTNDNYPLKEHRHYVGLNLGIRYHFN